MVYGAEFSDNLGDIERALINILRQDEALLPSCTISTAYNCNACDFACPNECLIARDHEFASYLRFVISRELALCSLIRIVISEHGRPLYQDIVTAMVMDRNPAISPNSVYAWLHKCTKYFKTFGINIYGLKEWQIDTPSD